MTEFKAFHGVRTAYRHTGEGQDVILLHGWGQNKDMMAAIEQHLSASWSVWNIDFPGFGESDTVPCAWGVEDYRDFLADFIRDNGIVNPVIIAHSFGCRVAIRYAALNPVRRMCLTGAAGLRAKQSASMKLKTRMYKTAKWILKAAHQDGMLKKLQDRSGSSDYRNASGVMRQTFVRVVNDDVHDILKDVKCPVLLVFGENDDATPLWMGKVMEQEMPDAGLAVFEGDDHYAYWHQPDRFNRVLDIFLKDGNE